MIDFRRYRVRLIIAFALALALHEILLSIVRAPVPATTREAAPIAHVLIVAQRRPAPTPRPTPPPQRTPPPRVTFAPIAHIAGRVHGAVAKHRAGGARRSSSHAIVAAHIAPHAAGSGVGSAVGIGAGDANGSGGGLAGNGTGTSGNGNGAVNANAPCGVVEFIPHASPKYDHTTAIETVWATVTFPDGHTESARFPYPWMYADGERTDPWSNTNLAKPSVEATLQLPPPDSDRSAYPPLITYILAHTNAGGYTDLPDCPKAAR